MIPEAAVEAAKSAYLNEFNYDENAEYIARLVLEAAAPHIRAQALEEAAADLDGKRLLSKAFHVYYPEWLRERANRIRN